MPTSVATLCESFLRLMFDTHAGLLMWWWSVCGATGEVGGTGLETSQIGRGELGGCLNTDMSQEML